MKKGFEVFKDGVNLRERKVKRGYLRQEEMNQVIMLASVHQLLMGIRSLHGVGDKEPAWIKFEKSGIITKEQIKYLKMATTYQRKFLDTLIVFDDNSYCPVDNLEGIKEKIDFELTIRGC